MTREWMCIVSDLGEVEGEITNTECNTGLYDQPVSFHVRFFLLHD
jgi:hypothetical protein